MNHNPRKINQVADNPPKALGCQTEVGCFYIQIANPNQDSVKSCTHVQNTVKTDYMEQGILPLD
jgi:hypothetical protein